MASPPPGGTRITPNPIGERGLTTPTLAACRQGTVPLPEERPRHEAADQEQSCVRASTASGWRLPPPAWPSEQSSASAAKVQVLPSDINAPGGEWSLTLTGSGGRSVPDRARRCPRSAPELQVHDRRRRRQGRAVHQSLQGHALSDVNAIGYSTFRDPDATDPSKIMVPSLQLPDRPQRQRGHRGPRSRPWCTSPISPPATPASRRLVAGLGRLLPGTAAGGWYATGAGDTASGCTPAATCTLAQLKTAFPQAKLYAIGLNQGSGNPGGKANVDALYVSLAGQGQTDVRLRAGGGAHRSGRYERHQRARTGRPEPGHLGHVHLGRHHRVDQAAR